LKRQVNCLTALVADCGGWSHRAITAGLGSRSRALNVKISFGCQIVQCKADVRGSVGVDLVSPSQIDRLADSFVFLSCMSSVTIDSEHLCSEFSRIPTEVLTSSQTSKKNGQPDSSWQTSFSMFPPASCSLDWCNTSAGSAALFQPRTRCLYPYPHPLTGMTHCTISSVAILAESTRAQSASEFTLCVRLEMRPSTTTK